MPQQNKRREAHTLGSTAERQARDHLVEAGMQHIVSGWRCRLGEIDLIMKDAGTLVFVEVRARSSGIRDAIESVDIHKQKRLVRAARAWLAVHPAESLMPARFDVVAIAGCELRWLRDVLSVSA